MPEDPSTIYPTFRMALVAYWKATSGLVAISPSPYADLAPTDYKDLASYCVLSEISSNASERGTRGRAYREDVFYQFAVYHRNHGEAVLLGETMTLWLDKIQDAPLRFATGYQRGWWRQGSRIIEAPKINAAGTRTLWQQAHIYKATVGRRRGT